MDTVAVAADNYWTQGSAGAYKLRLRLPTTSTLCNWQKFEHAPT